MTIWCWDGSEQVNASMWWQVVFVLTHGCDDGAGFEVYHKIATTSKGDVFPLKDKQLVKPILNFIRVSISSRQVTLLYNAAVQLTVGFNVHVDSCLEDLVVTATSHGIDGDISRVDVLGPSGGQFLEMVVNLKTAKVIKVESPETGIWTVVVSASGVYNLQIGGRSVCDFDPTFVYSLTPTSFYQRPAKGTVISCSVQLSAAWRLRSS